MYTASRLRAAAGVLVVTGHAECRSPQHLPNTLEELSFALNEAGNPTGSDFRDNAVVNTFVMLNLMRFVTRGSYDKE